MASRILSLRFWDIIEAIENIDSVLDGVSVESFESDWRKRWLVERGIEILSEASRHIPEDVKARQTGIPWTKVAAIGNILRHAYDRIAPDILWKLARDDLPPLAAVCRAELKIVLSHEEDD